MQLNRLIALVLVLVGVSFAIAHPRVATAANETSPQVQCFSTLKENMAEAVVFAVPLQQLATTTYTDIEPRFSRNYGNMSSFGIDVSKPVLELRLYSFGRQTGYVHPPKLPLPSSTGSDTWADPAKEFIIAEEYVVDQSAQRHFISCAFLQIRSDDLLKVTNDRYLYDGAMISMTKTATDGSYKAWYSENTSFDYQNKPFVDWLRLFVYPKSTQNTYFDKYDVADAYPANNVESFSALGFFANNLIQVQTYDKTGAVEIKYMVQKKSSGPFIEAKSPPELAPVTPEGTDKIFPLMRYNQAIEDRFPAFAPLLALRGTLQFDTFKQLIVEKDMNPEVGKLLSAIRDYRQLAAYEVDKKRNTRLGMSVSNPELDGLYLAVNDADTAVKQLAKGGVTLATYEAFMKEEKMMKVRLQTAGMALAGILGAAATLYLKKRRRAVS